MTTWGGIAGIGLGRLLVHLGESMGSSQHKRIVVKENGASPDWIIDVVFDDVDVVVV